MQINFWDTWYIRVWSGLLWIRTRSNGQLLWRWFTSWCHKRQEISSLTDRLLPSYERLYSAELVEWRTCLCCRYFWIIRLLCRRQSTWLVQQNRECLWHHATKHSRMTERCTVELRLFGMIGKASNPNMQKIRIIGFCFENRLHWQFVVRLLLFTVSTCI